MDELYSKLKEKNAFMDAHLVIKNSLSKSPGDVEIFQEFVNICLEIAMFNIVFDERKEYVNEANTALAIFSEATEMNEEALKIIKETRKRIKNIFTAICEEEQKFYNSQREKYREENTKLLNRLSDKLDELKRSKSQEKFDRILEEVAEIETGLDKEIFSPAQNSETIWSFQKLPVALAAVWTTRKIRKKGIVISIVSQKRS